MYLYHHELVSLTKRTFYADAAADFVQMRRLGQVVVSISIFHPGTVLNTTAAATGNPLKMRTGLEVGMQIEDQKQRHLN
jgi:hypothetical protein